MPAAMTSSSSTISTFAIRANDTGFSVPSPDVHQAAAHGVLCGSHHADDTQQRGRSE
jgi:hypothetical protein